MRYTAGGIEFTREVFASAPDQVIALRKQHPDQFNYIFKPSLTYEHIDLKIENPILADIRGFASGDLAALYSR